MVETNEARAIADLIKEDKPHDVATRLFAACREQPAEFQNLLQQTQKENARDLAGNKNLSGFVVVDGDVSITVPGHYLGNWSRNSQVVLLAAKAGHSLDAPADVPVFADKGSSTVKARSGSNVTAQELSNVEALSGALVIAEPDSKVQAQTGAIVVLPWGSANQFFPLF